MIKVQIFCPLFNFDNFIDKMEMVTILSIDDDDIDGLLVVRSWINNLKDIFTIPLMKSPKMLVIFVLATAPC
jgi:hypothetical protein